jgi:hypothetical protein
LEDRVTSWMNENPVRPTTFVLGIWLRDAVHHT